MPGSNDAPWRALYARVLATQNTKVKVGVLASKGGSAKHADSDMTLVEIAATHEFGSSDGHVPERSFIRSTLNVRIADELAEKVTAACKLVVTGKLDADKALALLGTYAASEIKNTITMNEADAYGEYPYPPLADSTIAAKGSSVPLIDTGQLKNSITYEVVHEG